MIKKAQTAIKFNDLYSHDPCIGPSAGRLHRNCRWQWPTAAGPIPAPCYALAPSAGPGRCWRCMHHGLQAAGNSLLCSTADRCVRSWPFPWRWPGSMPATAPAKARKRLPASTATQPCDFTRRLRPAGPALPWPSMPMTRWRPCCWPCRGGLGSVVGRHAAHWQAEGCAGIALARRTRTGFAPLARADSSALVEDPSNAASGSPATASDTSCCRVPGTIFPQFRTTFAPGRSATPLRPKTACSLAQHDAATTGLPALLIAALQSLPTERQSAALLAAPPPWHQPPVRPKSRRYWCKSPACRTPRPPYPDQDGLRVCL